jgi:clan AA aspartic protease (TIGR02281 family)
MRANLPLSILTTITAVMLITAAVVSAPAQEPRHIEIRIINPSSPQQAQGNAPAKVTAVTVMGNSVLVPVTLVHQDNQVDVQLLLDTGAGGTVIHTEIADRLNVDLGTVKKKQVRVAGGAYIEAHQVTLSRITVGPHTKENPVIHVIRHEGPASIYDGLLGMDLLRHLKYSVDFDKRIILWE